MSAKLFVRDFLSFFKAFNLPTGVTGVTPYPKYRQIEKCPGFE
jgi:predicted acetyltransferase